MSTLPSVLVVCTGNICRSPLGEAALRRRLPGVSVTSAGTDAREDGPATAGSIAAGAELGFVLDGHRSRRLTVGMVEEADLVIAMERAHREAIARAVPAAADRTFTLKELVLLLEGSGAPAGDLRVRVAAAAGRRPAPRDADLDVADPYGDGIDAYRRTAAEIDAWTDRLVRALRPEHLAAAGGA